MIQVGDLVRYGQSGVCRVEEKSRKIIAGNEQEYYVLTPLFKTGVVYVPCANEELVGRMLPLLTPDEVKVAVQGAKEASPEWIRDFRARSEVAKKALSSGDRKDALMLIKNICFHRKEEKNEGKRIHTTDDYFLRDAQSLIYSEFSLVLNRDLESVSDWVKGELELE